jgi:hypothetical protein
MLSKRAGGLLEIGGQGWTLGAPPPPRRWAGPAAQLTPASERALRPIVSISDL